MHAHEVAHIIKDVNALSSDEVEQIYGIALSEDGTVFDPTYNRNFVSVSDWAEFSVQQDEVDYSEEFGNEYV